MPTYTRNSSVSELLSKSFFSVEFLCRTCRHSAHANLAEAEPNLKLSEIHDISVCSKCEQTRIYVTPSTVRVAHLENDTSAQELDSNLLVRMAVTRAKAEVAKTPGSTWESLSEKERISIIKAEFDKLVVDGYKFVLTWFGRLLLASATGGLVGF